MHVSTGGMTTAVAAITLLIGFTAAPALAADGPLVREELSTDGPNEAPDTRPGGSRIGAGMVSLGDGTLLYFGGISFSRGPMADTWTWDDGEWTPECGTTIPGATDPCGPSARALHGMSGSNGRAVLYGGVTDLDTDRAMADSWTWDGGWHPVCGTGGTPCLPQMRMGPMMFDLGGTSYLFGGLGADDGGDELVYGDTWAFDGSNWTRVHDGSGTAPPPRMLGAAGAMGDMGVLFGGQADESGGSGPIRYETTPAPLRTEVPDYLVSNSPLSYDGTDFNSATFGGGLGPGAVVLASGEWYVGTQADDSQLTVNTRRATAFDVALLVGDSPPNVPTTLYIEPAVLESAGLTRDCAGAAAFVAGYGDVNPGPQTCHNYGQNVLTQGTPGGSFTYNGLGGFENAGPVTVVGGFSDPAITVNGTRVDDNQGPCCGSPDPGNMFFYGPPSSVAWIKTDGTPVPVDTGSGLSPVHAATFATSGVDITVYVVQSLLDSEGAAASCEGVEELLRSFGPDLAQSACRNFASNAFTPSGPEDDFAFNGFGDAQYPGLVELTPDFSATTPYIRVQGGAKKKDSSSALLVDTWTFDPDDNRWRPVCGTKMKGAEHDCGPGPGMVGSMAQLGSSSMLMAGSLVPDDDGIEWSGAVWLLEDRAWSLTTVGWPGGAEGSLKPGDVPGGLRLASKDGDCVVGYGNAPGTADGVTVVFGLDADGSGTASTCVAAATATPPVAGSPDSNRAGGPGVGGEGAAPTSYPSHLAATGPTQTGLAAVGLLALLAGAVLIQASRHRVRYALATIPPHGRPRSWR